MRLVDTQYTTYLTKNLVNGKQYYGAHTTTNIDTDKYVGSGKIIKQAIAKYGLDSFSVERQWTWDSYEEMMAVEQMAVGSTVVNDSAWYNLKEGGEGGKNPCADTRKKMSESRSQYFSKMSTEEKLKYSSSCVDTWNQLSVEQKEAHAERTRQQWKDKTPEEKFEAAEQTRQRWKDKTPEERETIERKRKASIELWTPEDRSSRKALISAGIKKAWANKTEEQLLVWKQNQETARTAKSADELADWQDKKSKAMIALPEVSCPHCDKKGKIGPMTRWHFDKCKHRNNK